MIQYRRHIPMGYGSMLNTITSMITWISPCKVSTFDPYSVLHNTVCAYWNIIRRMEQDALLAQLLPMGFDTEEIERCQVAMATYTNFYSLQEATEWQILIWVDILEVSALLFFVTAPYKHRLLQNKQKTVSPDTRPFNTLVLVPHQGSSHLTEYFQYPVSSSKDLSTSSQEQPLKSRYCDLQVACHLQNLWKYVLTNQKPVLVT